MHETEADWIEQRGIRDWYGSLPAAVAEKTGARCEAVGTALVAVLANEKSALFSRVLGLGVESAATPEQVDGVSGVLQRCGVQRAFVHVGPYSRPAELSDWLLARGLTRHPRGWMRFVREREPAPEPRTDLLIRAASLAEADAFDALVRASFGVPDTASGVFGAIVGRPSWHAFVALERDAVVGAAALFVEGGLGWLGFGCVDPKYRRRGGQSALLAARIQASLDLGCRALFTETGEAVAGDPQHSYHNIQRAGFRELVLRDNYLYVPAGL